MLGGADKSNGDLGTYITGADIIEGCDNIKQKTGATVLVVHHSGKDEAKGARGSSAFRAALDAEFHVKREDSNHALVLNCTKMKDAEEPERMAYDLRTAELFHDEDGELITSLVVIDRPRAVQEIEIIPANTGNKTDNHTALWQCVRTRHAHGEVCTRTLVRDDMKALGFDVKNFSRWVSKLEKDGLLRIDGENVYPLARPKSEEKSEER